MEQLPFYPALAMIIITLLTAYILYRAAGKARTVLLIAAAWLLLQAGIGLSGFYTNTSTMPPPFMLTVIPPLVLILVIFLTASGRRFVDSLNLRILTLLHTVRIPVEMVLWALFLYKTVPQAMTFEGRNLDIISGMTAPLVYYIVFVKKWAGPRWLLVWNILCLLLLLNIVVTAIIAAPFPFQQIAFDQPNIAVLYFPFCWLPCYVVPAVLFAHLAAIRQLLKQIVSESSLQALNA